jgi:hypothetical protein
MDGKELSSRTCSICRVKLSIPFILERSSSPIKKRSRTKKKMNASLDTTRGLSKVLKYDDSIIRHRNKRNPHSQHSRGN